MSLTTQVATEAAQFLWAPVSGVLIYFFKKWQHGLESFMQESTKKMTHATSKLDKHEIIIDRLQQDLSDLKQVPKDMAVVKAHVENITMSVSRLESAMLEKDKQ